MRVHEEYVIFLVEKMILIVSLFRIVTVCVYIMEKESVLPSWKVPLILFLVYVFFFVDKKKRG